MGLVANQSAYVSFRLRLKAAGFIVIFGWLCSSGNAAGIADAGFFLDKPSTLITFETDGAGNPVTVQDGLSLAFPGNEYAAFGVLFNPAVAWVNDAGPDFDAAQAIGGSMPIGIPGSGIDNFTLSFSVPVRAFGFWVVKAGTVLPSFTALDDQGQVIDSVVFDSNFVDGTAGVASFGFMGITADRNIASVQITKHAALFDNLYFSPIPEPGTLSLALFGALGMAGWLLGPALRRRY